MSSKPSAKKPRVDPDAGEAATDNKAFSALHEWAPYVNLKQATEKENKKEKSACALGASEKSDAKAKKEAEEESKEELEVPQVNHKAGIVAELTKLMNMYRNIPTERAKCWGYQRAITNIKAYPKPITDVKQMDDIPYVGDRIKQKVKEFISEGKLAKLENL